MTIFAVIRQPGANVERLSLAVSGSYPQHHYDLGNGVWLVADTGTASDVANKLGVTPEGLNGSAVILETASYYGRANPAIWTWMKTNWEAKGG